MAAAGSNPPDARQPPVAVVGAGIIGVATAIWLQRDGHEVVLIDRGAPGDGASYGNGGVLASCSVVPVTVPGLLAKAPRMVFDPGQPLFMKWAYLPRLLPWLRRYLGHANAGDARRIAAALAPVISDSLTEHEALAAGTGAEKWLKPCDYVFLYRDRTHYLADAFAWDLRRAHGFSWRELGGAALRDQDPALAPDIGFAASLGGHGAITDPGRYVKALAAHFVARGGRMLTTAVTDFVREDGRIQGVRAGAETIACRAVVVCAGAWSKPLARKLGLKIPLESERGYHVELLDPSVIPRAPCMVAAGKFVMTPMEGRLRLAGIVEFGGLERPPSPAPFDLLVKQAQATLPGLRWTERREWMGHRPAPADSIPIIGEAPRLKGAFLGFGHHHVGLTGGPRTGRLLAQLVSGRTPNLDLAPYAPSRFQ